MDFEKAVLEYAFRASLEFLNFWFYVSYLFYVVGPFVHDV